MLLSTLRAYIQGILSHIPGAHWAAIGAFSFALTISLLLLKKCSVYGAIALGFSVFAGLFLLDTAVVIRHIGAMRHQAGFDLSFDFLRVFRKNGIGPAEVISNYGAFVSWGFFLSEYLTSTRRFSSGHRIGFVTLAAFGLSLCIECLQLLLRVGFFELTDLVMNTLGAFIGASLAVLGRALFPKGRINRIK